jgi:capsular exopolysaccharide synthesis family protein
MKQPSGDHRRKGLPGCESYLQWLRKNPHLEHAYATLLERLYLCDSQKSSRSLLITSTQPAEGKTTVAVTLSLTATIAEKKVLLIDADFKKPRIHRLLGLDNTLGLSHALSGRAQITEVIQEIKMPLEAGGPKPLHVITSGSLDAPKGNMVLKMNSPAFREILDYAGRHFDLIILDSAPALAVTDPLFLAPHVDDVLLVLAAGVVVEKDAKQAKERIEQVGGRILGVVLNRFSEHLHGPGYHPYYQDYAGE